MWPWRHCNIEAVLTRGSISHGTAATTQTYSLSQGVCSTGVGVKALGLVGSWGKQGRGVWKLGLMNRTVQEFLEIFHSILIMPVEGEVRGK